VGGAKVSHRIHTCLMNWSGWGRGSLSSPQLPCGYVYGDDCYEHRGVHAYRSKCEVVGHTDKTRKMFNSLNAITLPESSGRLSRITNVSRAASQLGSGSHVKEELQRLTKRLELMKSHDSLFLWRNVLAASRLVYLRMTVPCCDSPATAVRRRPPGLCLQR
jgi:hypothetical protein